MKVLGVEYNVAGEIAVVPMGDDVLLRNNGDFYLPEFSREVSCVPQLVVRICKLGKSVSKNFAARYYQEIGVGVRFYADDLKKILQEKQLPVIVASSFDCSAAISGLVIPEKGEVLHYSMWVNDMEVFSGNSSELPVGIDSLVSLASDFHTLKIGDFMFCGNTFRYRDLKIEDRIRVYFNEKKFLDFKIK